jgi:high-affinity nickel-transport protein
MTPAEWPATGLALFFMLGLRHGAEPDHIAAIDGMTLRAIDRDERHAAWVGTLFALGHGVAIAALAVAVSLLAASFVLPAALVAVFAWLPVLLLVGLGVWNLRALLAPGDYRPDSFRLRLMPRSLRERTDLWSSFVIGLLFALVIDTLAHVSAWSVFATTHGGWQAGVTAGLLFSIGMLTTSSIDSQLLARLLRRCSDPAGARRYRRGVGWLVVGLSFAAAGQSIAGQFDAGPEIGEDTAVGLGAATLVALSALWAWRWQRGTKPATIPEDPR